MTVFNSGTGDRLYQAAIEAKTRKVITRYTADGATWSAWSVDASSMKAFGNVTMAVFNGRLYQAMRQFNALTPGVGKVWTRSTADGVTWSAWEYAGLKAKQPAALEVAAVNNQTRLYLAINSGGKVRTRYTANGEALVAGMQALGFRVFLDPAIQAPIIYTFHAPADPAYEFKRFYAEVRDRGFILYPGKLTQIETFRVGCIGAIGRNEMEQAVHAVALALQNLGIASGAPA